MTDPQGHSRSTRVLTAGQVAEIVGGRVEGDPSVQVEGIAPLNQAQGAELGFLAQRRYLKHLSETQARTLLVSEDLAGEAQGHPSRIVVKDPHVALPKLLAFFYPTQAPEPGIHPTAVLGKGVEMGEGITIGPYAVVEEGTVLGNATELSQVWMNLILNAADVSGGRGSVKVQTSRKDDKSGVSITDDGPGIPDEHKKQLFKPFFNCRS